MKKQKHVNAGLKSPADLAVRLEAGEEFWLDGSRIHYNSLKPDPFRIADSPMSASWSAFAEMTKLVECEWWEVLWQAIALLIRPCRHH